MVLKLNIDSMHTPNEIGKAIRGYYHNSTNLQPIKTLSIFSGAGGLDIGFHDVGFDIKAMVEIDSRFTKTLEANKGHEKYYGNTPVIETIDIQKYFPDKIGDIDVIIGGPPCQPFSSAGRRAAGVEGFNSPQGNLFKSYVRLLEKIKPKVFVFENVYGITGAQGGQLWKKITEDFGKVGYKLHHRILDTADYGVPQHRERVIIIGTKKGSYKFPRPTHGPDSSTKQPYVSAAEAIQGIQFFNKTKEFGGRYGKLLTEIPPGLNYSFFTHKLGHPDPVFGWRSKFSDFLYKADPKRPVRTIKASGGKYTGPLHWENRHFSIAELKRLQTFPDEYTMTGNENVIRKQIGNSVPPSFARILALSLREQIFNEEIPVKLDYLEDNEDLNFRTRKRELTNYYNELAQTHLAKIKPRSQEIEVNTKTFTLSITDRIY